MINNKNGKTLINIGLSGDNQDNYIQSDAGADAKVKLDLTQGSFDIQAKGILDFLIDSTPNSEEDPYFKIAVPKSNEVSTLNNNLVLAMIHTFNDQGKAMKCF